MTTPAPHTHPKVDPFDEPTVWAVIHLPGYGNGAITRIYTDLDEAHRLAHRARGVVVPLPIVADYRRREQP